jgi:hypothetical protein
MRKLIATIALLGLAVPANAATCNTLTVTRLGDSPLIAERDQADTDIKTGVVGRFLWIQLGDGDMVSAEIPVDAVSATVCSDSSVTFTVPVDETETVEDDEPRVRVGSVVIADIYDEWRQRGYDVYPS